VFVTAKFPEIGCSYIPPDQCTDFTPASCCERIEKEDDDKDDDDDDDKDVIEDGEGAGVVVMTSMALLIVLSALAVVL
jgi:hypothetical protein